ncbi:2',5' RNA ligase family [Rhodobacteraceae bacterium THAF1]|uniref:RNA 2',3'-cyclic phosphodiesterase n=1 Tax=Palleronia sp. THAF1 TaxID=2587842 RepID=UPI000F3F6051|nr:RNA 2',3'-cyclic phosphodiesterase [Palleronia sp. THAF1]QFU09361.1 2',5' RNA ligase family [Palleronia sp. THAF1]VDC22063.1 2',5' RNA ligase family [Rhodobacteraceae bacterium THAF1]
MRCFLALDPPDTLRDALAALQDGLRVGRLVDEDDLHLTLAFMGDMELDALDELNLDLEMLRPGPVRIEVTGLDTFGSINPRSLHASARPHPELDHLNRKVETLVRRAGHPLPHHRFVPHITLARFRHRMPPEDHVKLGRFLSAHGNFRFDPVSVDRLMLYQSTLTDDGPRYDLLEEYALA